jgi:hypothetical protein
MAEFAIALSAMGNEKHFPFPLIKTIIKDSYFIWVLKEERSVSMYIYSQGVRVFGKLANVLFLPVLPWFRGHAPALLLYRLPVSDLRCSDPSLIAVLSIIVSRDPL